MDAVTSNTIKKEKPEFIEWTEKNIDEEITIFLQKDLSSMSVMPAEVVRHVDVVAGGDHGDMAFQFGLSVLVDLADGCTINFEVLTCELIRRKDTGHLLEETILQRLTNGLEIISTFQLHLFIDNESGVIIVEYLKHGPTPNAIPSHTPPSPKSLSRATWPFKPWHLGRSQWPGTGACSARPADTNFQTTASCGRWTSL